MQAPLTRSIGLCAVVLIAFMMSFASAGQPFRDVPPGGLGRLCRQRASCDRGQQSRSRR